jgi:F-type H+-transporting ATPase subunit b
MTIDWWTLGLQLINFLVLVWLLQRFLYKPALEIIAKRKKMVEQAFEEASETEQSAADAQQKFENEQVQLAQSRQELMQQTHAELEKERQQILDDARAEAASLLDSARQQMQSERVAALKDTKTEIADLAADMAATLLQQVAADNPQADLASGFLTRLVDRLKQLPEEERQSLHQDANGSAEGLCVITSTPLPDDQQEHWRDAISQQLGTLSNLSFESDPEILGGVELRFPHAVLSLAWSESLRQGRDALLADETFH